MEVLEAKTTELESQDFARIEMRKFRLMEYIFKLDDSNLLDDLEDYVFGIENELSPAILELLDERLARLDAHPESLIPWETVKSNLKKRHELRHSLNS